MDPAEDQQQELEALQSIYPTELTVVEDKYPDIELEIELLVASTELPAAAADSDADDSDSEPEPPEDLQVQLGVRWPADYPSVSQPILSVTGLEDVLSDKENDELVEELNGVAEENAGMASTFCVISHLQEYLLQLNEKLEERRKLESEREFREQEERDRQKTEGTKVTVENFMAWKEKFDEEMSTIKRERERQRASGRLTGKQQFLSDASLCLSDVAMTGGAAETNDGAVDIDESLFDDLDALDVDDDDDDEGDDDD